MRERCVLWHVVRSQRPCTCRPQETWKSSFQLAAVGFSVLARCPNQSEEGFAVAKATNSSRSSLPLPEASWAANAESTSAPTNASRLRVPPEATASAESDSDGAKIVTTLTAVRSSAQTWAQG